MSLFFRKNPFGCVCAKLIFIASLISISGDALADLKSSRSNPLALVAAHSTQNESMISMSFLKRLRKNAQASSKLKSLSNGRGAISPFFRASGTKVLDPADYTQAQGPDGLYYGRDWGEFDCSTDSDTVVFGRIPCVINGNAITIQAAQPAVGGYSHSVFQVGQWEGVPKTVSFDISAPALEIPGTNYPVLGYVDNGGDHPDLVYQGLIVSGATTQHITIPFPNPSAEGLFVFQVGQRIDNSPVHNYPPYTISKVTFDYLEAGPSNGNNTGSCGKIADPQICSAVGQPVNVSTGAMWHVTNDFVLPGRTSSTSLTMNRSYTAFAASAAGDLGPNWRHAYESKLVLTNLANVVWIDEDGGPWSFTRVNGAFVSILGVTSKLFSFSDHYELRKKDHTVLHYDLTGKLQKIIDRHGEMTTLTYDSFGHLSTVSAPVAGSLVFTRNSLGYISSVTRSRDNLTYSYAYDSNGRLSQVTDFAGLTYKYSYVTEQPNTYAQGMLATITDPINRVTQFSYFDDGKARQQIEAGGGTRTFTYSPAAGTPVATTVQEIDGSITTYHIDGQFHTTQIDQTDGSKIYNVIDFGFLTGIIDELNFRTTYGHDSNGNRTAIQRPADSSPTLIANDPIFNVPTLVTPNTGAPTAYTLDPNSGDILQVGRTANSTSLSLTYTRDAFGNLLSTNNGRAAYADVRDANGLLTTVFDSHNPETRAYDSRSRVSTRTFLSGRVLTYTYDDYDRVTQIADSAGPTINSTYDAMGRLLAKTVTDGHKPQTTQYVWDAHDRLVSQTDAIGRKTKYTYESSRILPNPSAITDPAGRVTSFQYNSRGRMILKADPSGAATHYTYDTKGQLLTVTDAAGNVTSYQYDGNGRKVAEGRPSILGSDPISSLITYSYDGADHLISEVHHAATSENNRTINYQYDAFDRLIQKALLKGSTVEDQINYAYEPQLDGTLLTSVTNSVSNLGFSPEATPPFSNTAFSVAAVESGNPNGLIQDQFTISRDSTGNISSVAGTASGAIYSKTYDPAGRLLNVDAGPLKTAIEMDGFGRRAKLANSDGSSQVVNYDSLNRITRIKWKEGYKNSVQEYLRYDLAGNVVGLGRENARYELGYDEMDQLVSSKHRAKNGVTDYNRQFGYDLIGNRVNDDQGTTSDSFVSNFLLRNGVSSFEADPNGFGEVAKETTADQVKNYNYRADGKIAAYQSGSLQVSYLYDGLNRLTAKLINQNGTSYTQSYAHLGDESRVLMGKAGDGSVTAYIDGQGVSEHLGEVKGAMGKAYITDHLGSVLNSVVAGSSHAFGLFGEMATKTFISSTSPPVPFGFTGHMIDLESGLNRTKYRQYDSKVGRWLSQEPRGKDGPNFYWYARNSVLKYKDSTGLYPCPQSDGAHEVNGECGSGLNEPLIPDQPKGYDFRFSCYNHDNCYSSSSSKSQCDWNFLASMKRSCNGDRECNKLADIYYLGVDVAGKSAYDDAQKENKK